MKILCASLSPIQEMAPMIRYDNLLLERLTPAERARIHPALTPVPVQVRQVLFDVGDPADVVWLPLRGAALSLVQVFMSGAVVEAGVVGDEGIGGLEPFLDAPYRLSRGLVQGPGTMLRGDVRVFVDEFRRGGNFQQNVLRFASALFIQVAQTVGCNRLHNVEARTARWLLWLSDRCGGTSELIVTQDLLADMLGTRRASVSVALAALSVTGAVSHSRNRVEIRRRATLVRNACECYERHSTEYEKLLRN
jgi:CRP-like cAMP-binding protein